MNHRGNVGRYAAAWYYLRPVLTYVKLEEPTDHTTASPTSPLLSRTNLPDPPSTPISPPRKRATPASQPISRASSFIASSPSHSPLTNSLPGGSLYPATFAHVGTSVSGREGSTSSSKRRLLPSQGSTRSPSPDPLLLFTPTTRLGSPRSQQAGVSSPTSSPLTPSPSADKDDHDHSPPSPRPSPLPGPSQQQQQQPPIPPSVLQELAQEDADQSRYSLRTRNARQINPYQFDSRMYKRQMRANPDAIVKVVSPPRAGRRQRSASRSPHGNSSGAEDEYRADDDDGADESQTQTQWKGKERAAESGMVDKSDEEARLPVALREALSSDEDLDLVQLVDREKRRKEKEQRRRRHKPFPLKSKDLPGASSHADSRVRVLLSVFTMLLTPPPPLPAVPITHPSATKTPPSPTTTS